jgi:SAM-dependent methyltransferase
VTRLGRCPACDDGRRRAFGAKDSLVLVRCGGCGLVYSDPQPREEARREYLEELDLAAHFAPLAARKRVLYERRLARLPRPSPGRDRLCDVGCGDGQFLELARSRGWQPHGVELNPPAVARARQRSATVFEGTLESMADLPWGTFSAVTSWDVLEHTPEPRRFAERLVRLLAPGGTLTVTTLNRRSLAALCFRTKWSMVGPGHFTYWDVGSLRRLFEGQGLIVTDLEIFGLGRDFFQWVDHRGSRHRRPATGESPSPPPGGGWDVHPVVLAVETLANRLFTLVGGGVGIGLALRMPTAGPAAAGRSA